MGEKLLLVDGHSILHRAFYGVQDLTNSKGTHTNAVFGFVKMLLKFLEEERPDYLTVAFDVSEPTFRHKMYPEYKGTRKPMAPELREQVPLVKDLLHAMGVITVEKGGFEADDILGTIARMAEGEGVAVSILSGDRDLLQLATGMVRIRIPKTKSFGNEVEDYDDAAVKERYGVTPQEFIDVKALMGDASDNIPGVPGIGEKTAIAIIEKYGSIESAYEHADEVRPPRASKNIREYYDQARLCKALATIDVRVDLPYELSGARFSGTDSLFTGEAYKICRELDFKEFLPRFSQEAQEGGAGAIETRFARIRGGEEARRAIEGMRGRDAAFFIVPREGGDAGASLGQISPDDVLGIALCYSSGEGGEAKEDGADVICYLEAGAGIGAGELLSAFAECGAASLSTIGLKQQVAPLGMLEKKEYRTLSRGIFFDCAIAAYLLNPLKGEYPYEDIAKDYAGALLPSRKDLIGKLSYEDASSEAPGELLRCVCGTAYAAYASRAALERGLVEAGMDALFREIEMPLSFTLADMEKEGIGASGAQLADYGETLEGRIGELEERIYEEAGERFNINSPRQLGTILFEKKKLPSGKKTKTGYSTAAEVLERLAPDYPIVSDILSYRQLSKLKSTYADGLSECIAKDGRIHTTFQQTIAATGRLSSTEPNLQNIPMRIELGRLIRKAFLPREGFVFVDADYSQIELRVLAHLSGDENLIEAYRSAQDIHRATASQVFHVPLGEVTDQQRRNAKAVNFGIVYGISSFGLSQDLSISRKEAADYIERYFETYPGIKSYLDSLVSEAREKGYAVTMFGRRRPIPELSSSNFSQRSFGERVAMNSPIQGTAADIIKIAMNRVHDRLLDEGMSSRLILTVHDELLVEAEAGEEEEVARILREEMQGAADLAVPLEIDAHSGRDWYEAK